jgi:Zn-dependent protease
MTLNPLKHMGGMSLILLLVAGIAWGAMPITPSRLRGRHARALVAIAGPVSNVVMAILAIGIVGLWQRLEAAQAADITTTAAEENLRYFLWVFGSVNVTLALFNLLPVPPLDGSRILADMSPAYSRMLWKMQAKGQSMLPFLVVFFFAGRVITPAAGAASEMFLRLVRGV